MTFGNDEYWESTGSCRSFTTPLPPNWALNWNPHGAVLEVGCGYGRICRWLKDQGYSPVGIDPSAPLIARATRANPEIPFHVARLDEHLAVNPRPSYAAVVMCGVMENFVQPADRVALAEHVSQALVEGGHFYLETFVRDIQYEDAYRAAVELGHPYGTLSLDEGRLLLFHDTPTAIDRLFGAWRKIRGEECPFQTWSGKTVNGYEVLFQRR